MLPDGRVVVLTRYQEFYGPHEMNQPPTESDYWFEFKHPDTGELVRWKSDRDLATIALLINKGLPELLVTPRFGTSIFRYQCPDPLYLLHSPSDARAEIESHDHHLPWRLVGGHVPGVVGGASVIDFREMGTQTFGMHCSPPFNFLSDQKGRST